ncbi:MAG: hypothetical protein ABI053_03615 [Lacisediminihabitans sp.]
MTSHSSLLPGFSRKALVGMLVAATAVLTFGGVPMAAQAADVGTMSELQVALAGNDPVVTLTTDVGSAATDNLVVSRDVTLDLNGHTLYAKSTTIEPGHNLTLNVNGGTNLSYAMDVEGTLTLGSDLNMPDNATITVGTLGKIVSDGTPRTLSGSPAVANSGIITAIVAKSVADKMTGNNYTVRFIDNMPSDNFQDLKVYAPSFAAAGMVFPTFPRTHAKITSWNATSDGSSTVLTTTTPLSGANLYAYAQWAPDGITSIAASYDASPDPASAGDIKLNATDTTPGGNGGNITDFVDFTSNIPADTVAVWDPFTKFLNTGLVGPHVITGTLNGSPAVTNSVTIPVVAGYDIGAIALTMTPTSVVTGATSTAYLSATDGYGNSFGINLITSDNCKDCGGYDPVLTSSDPTDAIDPATGVITFTTLGLHTITVSLDFGEGGYFTADTTVNVTAVPVVPPAPQLKTLAFTGIQQSPAPWIALFLILLGMAAVTVARRRKA